MSMLASLAAVFAGGLVGTTVRLLLDTVMPHDATQFPLSTFVINVVGAAVLGILVGALWSSPRTPGWMRAGLGTGLLGSFTTFSAVASSLVAQAAAGQWALAAVYLVATVVLGVAAAWAGLATGQWLARRTALRFPPDRRGDA